MDRGLGQFFRQLRRVDVVLRQLVGAVEDVGETELGVGGEHMGLQMNPHRFHLCRRNAARRNLEARPGQQRHGDHDDIESAVAFRASCFGTGFDHVGQFVIGARTAVVQMVEHGDQGFLAVVGQQVVDMGCKAGFPPGILDPVRRLAEPRCKAGKKFGVRRLAGAARKAGAFHGERGRKNGSAETVRANSTSWPQAGFVTIS